MACIAIRRNEIMPMYYGNHDKAENVYFFFIVVLILFSTKGVLCRSLQKRLVIMVKSSANACAIKVLSKGSGTPSRENGS